MTICFLRYQLQCNKTRNVNLGYLLVTWLYKFKVDNWISTSLFKTICTEVTGVTRFVLFANNFACHISFTTVFEQHVRNLGTQNIVYPPCILVVAYLVTPKHDGNLICDCNLLLIMVGNCDCIKNAYYLERSQPDAIWYTTRGDTKCKHVHPNSVFWKHEFFRFLKIWTCIPSVRRCRDTQNPRLWTCIF